MTISAGRTRSPAAGSTLVCGRSREHVARPGVTCRLRRLTAVSSCGGEVGEYNGGTEVMASGVVEIAATGYQAQSRIPGRSVNSFRWEFRFDVLAHTGDAENRCGSVRQPYLNDISRPEASQRIEDTRPLIGINVPFDDRHADLAGRRRVLVPCGLTGRCVKRRYPDRAVGVDT